MCKVKKTDSSYHALLENGPFEHITFLDIRDSEYVSEFRINCVQDALKFCYMTQRREKFH